MTLEYNPLVHAPPLALPSSGGEYQRAVKDEEGRIIPFLRQLTDMLQNNEELISFVPGQRLPNKTILGLLIIHDRSRVQAEVLPVYFNHASFASLRRQLSYFSFVRVGKSRQSGVTYTNEAVVELSDILRLKRQAAIGTRKPPAGGAAAQRRQKTRRKQQAPPSAPEQQRATASAEDAASAVRSGAVHADRTHRTLDIDATSTGNEGDGCSSFNPVSFSSNNVSQSPPSLGAASSASRSEIVSNTSDSESKDPHCGRRTPQSTRSHHRPKCPGAAPRARHALPEKERARFKRLCSNNAIVPFIHLPVRARRRKAGSAAPSPATGAVGAPGHAAPRSRVALSTQHAPEMSRDRATRAGAVNALLALGNGR